MTNPQEVVAAALRRERSRTGLSLSEVARRAGIGKSTLSQLEAAQGNPSLETLWALCTALGIAFSELVSPTPTDVTVIRASEGEGVAATDSPYTATLLSSSPTGVRRDLYRIDAEPGSPRRSVPHSAGMVEHVVIIAGRASVGPSDEPVDLETGDYMTYRGDSAHVFSALTPGTVALLVTETSQN
jgi:transcriptional regulator with XRE-family HTH domain